eukprot:180376_1
MAGVACHSILLKLAAYEDEKHHVDIIQLSRSHDISDRTDYLLKGDVPNSSSGMIISFKCALNVAKNRGMKLVFGVPCNTFHAPPIWDLFEYACNEATADSGGASVHIVHMLRATLAYIHELCPNARRIGLLSTTGTRESGVYKTLFDEQNLELVQVPISMQPRVHASINDPEYGVKARSPVTERARADSEDFVRVLKENGAEAAILGCTEIPLALPMNELHGIPLINPVVALCREMIRKSKDIS